MSVMFCPERQHMCAKALLGYLEVPAGVTEDFKNPLFLK